MANEFYVRKGLAIATSSIATASGATQATKYLVVGDDSVIRWATASVTSGVSGTSGIDGTSGTSGSSGTSGTSGSSGTSGTSGVSGTSGTSGSSGVQGESAGIPYNYITSGTLSDPGSGNLKFISSGFLSSVSQILVNHNDLNTNDNELFLESLSGGVLTLKSNLNSGTNFAVFTITSVTNFSTYVSFSVNISFTTGNWSFVSTDLVVLNFSKSGTSGTSGVNGTSGTSGVNGTSGTSGVSFVGSGTNDYLARWTPDGSTLGNSLIQDDGTNIGVNYAPQSGVQLAVGNSVNPTSVYVLNSYATSSTTKGLQVLSIGTPTDGPRIGVDIYVSPSPSNYGLKINDGREGLGKVLTSDATGNAYWSNNIGTTGSTITLTGNLVLNTATASSGVFSHYFQVTVNGTLLKIPLYY